MDTVVQTQEQTFQAERVLCPDFSTLLQEEFASRCRKNPRYSLRAFAKLLEIDASSLSKYMSSKRRASTKMVIRFCRQLNVHPEQERALLKKLNFENREKTIATPNYAMMETDAFNFIADWYHVAILELSCTEGFDSQPTTIARKLGLNAEEVKAAIARLERLQLIKPTATGFTKTNRNLSNFTPGLTSAAHKQFQKQCISKALRAVDECPQDKKDITTISMAIDKTKLPEARALIAEFRKKMCAFLEEGQQTDVYNLSVQLYPVGTDE